ncbi:plasmid mobilization protein [Dyadobacter fanqingshengii]|nr:plasmid mobilization relaxosome protein MobC [Dyadobacter fanqingshengii]USJ34473.1 plasmid mobilization relaxosome protein MobC [Dyadobacter fanqingshengii]
MKEFLMFESVDRIVMKEEKSNKTRHVIFRLTPKEYANLEAKRSRTTCRKLSEFLRLLIFNRPVTVIERNGSQDQMIGELSELREELNRLGNNFNQATKRLNAVNQISEFRNWIASYEAEKTFMFSVLDMIKSQTDKLADRWLQ